MGRTIAYCRVSARDQNPQLQLDALREHGYDALFHQLPVAVQQRPRGDQLFRLPLATHPSRPSTPIDP